MLARRHAIGFFASFKRPVKQPKQPKQPVDGRRPRIWLAGSRGDDPCKRVQSHALAWYGMALMHDCAVLPSLRISAVSRSSSKLDTSGGPWLTRSRS